MVVDSRFLSQGVRVILGHSLFGERAGRRGKFLFDREEQKAIYCCIEGDRV